MVYDNIKNSVPLGLSKLEIARYLYMKCAQAFCFDTKINNTDCSMFYGLLNQEIVPQIFNSIQVNCFTWSQFYSSLLSDFEIDNKVVKFWHSYVNFFIDGVRWVADATYGKYSDISRIRYGDKTQLFGPCIYNDIDSNTVTNKTDFVLELDDMDRKLGYSKNNFALILKKLLFSIKNDDIHKYISCDDDVVVSKLKFIFLKVGCLSFGYYEAKEFIFELEKILLSDSEFGKVTSIELVRNNNSEIDILQCICVDSCNGFVYFILCPNLPIYQIYYDDFSSLFYLGFKPKKIIPGINQSIITPFNNQILSRYDFVQAKTKKLDYVSP